MVEPQILQVLHLATAFLLSRFRVEHSPFWWGLEKEDRMPQAISAEPGSSSRTKEDLIDKYRRVRSFSEQLGSPSHTGGHAASIYARCQPYKMASGTYDLVF